MGDCTEVHDNASDFIDGEVPSKFTSRIKHHLGFCDDCDGWACTSGSPTAGAGFAETEAKESVGRLGCEARLTNRRIFVSVSIT
jgi:predicted anti-sigma-YlaC factor YlaD